MTLKWRAIWISIVSLAYVGGMLLTYTSNAHAADCNSVFVDELGIVTNPSDVEAAARGLGSEGVTVRARVFKSIESTVSLDAYVEHLCSSWRSPDERHWLSTLALLVYLPGAVTGTNDIGFYYGVANQSQFSDWRIVLKTKFVPHIRAYKEGEKDALTAGFTQTLQALRLPFVTRGTGSVTINQSDNAWAGKMLVTVMWIGFAAVLLVLLSMILRTFAGRSTRRSEALSAQSEAKRVRSLCVSGILEITDDTTLDVLDSKVTATQDPVAKQALLAKLVQVRIYGQQASSAFNSFDSLKGDDPNRDGLSPQDYRNNQDRYADILTRYVSNARTLISDIQAGNTDPHKPTTITGSVHPWEDARTRRHAHRPRSNGYDRPAPQPATPPAAPAAPTTTIIREESSGGFGSAFTGGMLGSVVGNALSEDEPRRRRRYDEDTPASSSSSSSNWDTGSSSSSSSSSDDGGGSWSSSSSSGDDGGGSWSSSDSSSSSSDSGGSFSSGNC